MPEERKKKFFAVYTPGRRLKKREENTNHATSGKRGRERAVDLHQRKRKERTTKTVLSHFIIRKGGGEKRFRRCPHKREGCLGKVKGPPPHEFYPEKRGRGGKKASLLAKNRLNQAPSLLILREVGKRDKEPPLPFMVAQNKRG